jgi:hypothetical protein
MSPSGEQPSAQCMSQGDRQIAHASAPVKEGERLISKEEGGRRRDISRARPITVLRAYKPASPSQGPAHQPLRVARGG